MRRALALLLPLAISCTVARDGDTDSTAAAARADSLAASTQLPRPETLVVVLPDSAPITIDRSVERDLTGDGRPERIMVSARGTRYDSLGVQLVITDTAGRARYTHAWNSGLYFIYADTGMRSADADRLTTERHILRLVSDSAFIALGARDAKGQRIEVDTNAVRYHLAELELERMNGGRPVPGVSNEDAMRIADSLVVAIADDVRDRPTYTYFAGGEATYSIRWSPKLQRFVRVFACC